MDKTKMRHSEILRILSNAIAPLKRQVQLMIGRAIITTINDSPGIQQVNLKIYADDVKDKTELFSQFGFVSSPPPGTECIMLSVGGNRDHGVVIATEHRDLRLKGLASGDSAQYNKNGKYIMLKGDNCEMLLSKLKINNASHELMAVLYEFMDEVSKGKVTTAIGPQTWDPATKTILDNVKAKALTFKV